MAQNPALLRDIDRLARLRALMSDLKAEEEELRHRLLTLRDGVCAGTAVALTVRTLSQRWFDRDRLPETLLADPAMWKTVSSRQVVIHAP